MLGVPRATRFGTLRAGMDDTPLPPDPPPPDATLHGYIETHTRPPAFEGPDGAPYTVSLEIESTGDLRAPFVGYLIFPRWADTGVGIVGHVESRELARGASRVEVEERLGALTLIQVQGALDEAVRGPDDQEDHDRAS